MCLGDPNCKCNMISDIRALRDQEILFGKRALRVVDDDEKVANARMKYAQNPTFDNLMELGSALAFQMRYHEAIECFESLPKDYTLSDFNPTASEWLADIDTVYHCDFVGKLNNDAMSFEVIREIDSFGIRFKYQKTEGSQIAEGYVIRRADDDTIADLQSDSAELHPDAIAGLCHLKLMPDGTMNLYVNGELQQTFSK